jgi:hypothetical protein
MTTFRKAVEAIEDPDDKIKIQTGYLLAARASEILTKTTPFDMLRNRSKPYGVFMKAELKDFEMTPLENPALKETLRMKAFVITSAVAKRGKKIKRKNVEQTSQPMQLDPEEVKIALLKFGQTELYERWQKKEVQVDPLLIKILLGEITYKVIAVPCDNSFEPWCLPLLQYWRDHDKKLSFDITRERLRQIYRENLKGIMPSPNKKSRKNILRHYRLSHLLEYYNFDAVQLTNYSGWTFKSAFGFMGIPASGNLDYYLHLQWKQYFPKLLRPIASMS